MKTVIAISAGHNETKKESNIIRDRIRYLNYGLLGLATILHHQGNIDVRVFQADHLTVEELFATINNSGIDIDKDCECFLLSIPSYYSMSWCCEFCKEVGQRFHKRIIVGGRWVVDNHSEWIRSKLHYVDTIIEGFGERPLSQYFSFPDNVFIQDGSKQCFDWLDYELLYDYRKYQPCIEISRGCGSGCKFCADRENKRLPNKSVETIKTELDHLDQQFGDYSIYFEAPHFLFEHKWTIDLCQMICKRRITHTWRCTSRVETVPLDALSRLRDAGLKVLDIGLESASPKQLVNMHKTNNPKKYLERAEKLLMACKENDIWVKFNLLLYAGETYQTVLETEQWLIDRKDLIKDVSASNLVYYYNMDCIDELIRLGASVPEGQSVEQNGYINLNLSSEIDHNEANRLSVHIPKLIASQKDFYDIKAISYFEKGYSYSDFLQDLENCDVETLPFTILKE